MLKFNEYMDEALSAADRRQKARTMKRMKNRLKIARKKSMRRTATTDTLKKRAQRSARAAMAKKFSGGKSKSDMSLSQRKSVEKRLDRVKGRISNLAKRKVKDVRKLDRARK